MHTAPSECPVCHDGLLVTRLICRNRGTTLESRFTLERLFDLLLDQRYFVEPAGNSRPPSGSSKPQTKNGLACSGWWEREG